MEHTTTLPCCGLALLPFAHLVVLVVVILVILSINLRNLNGGCGDIVLLLLLSIHGVACPRLRLSRILLPRVEVGHIGASLLGIEQLIVLLDAILRNG